MANDYSRRRFIASAASLPLISSGLPQVASASGQSAENRGANKEVNRPNLILFMPDELRADAIACFGNSLAKTPNFDRLASQGTKFSNCHVQYPVCGASRCSLLTGWPTSVRGHRSLAYFLRPDEPNLFRYLKRAGYDVFWFGKNDALAAQSFADSVTQWNFLDGKPVGGFEGGGRRYSGPSNPSYPRTFIETESPGQTQTTDYKYVNAAINVLERREQDRPFCIFLALTTPHPPYGPPREFRNMHSPADVTNLRPIGLPNRPNYVDAIRKASFLDKEPIDTFKTVRALYYDAVSYTDWLLGQIMEAMERTNHNRDTALFLLSDHGDYAGDYGLVEKWPSGLEDPLTHVPVIASVPGLRPGGSSEEIIELFDVMATCLELAGTRANHTHFARSLMPQLRGLPGDKARCAFAEGGYNLYEPQCFENDDTDPTSIYYPKEHLETSRPETITRVAMIRTPDYKLIHRPQGQSELYVYADDPNELNNRFGESRFASLQAELQSRLLSWYVNTTGIAPKDRDQRGFPQFIQTPDFPVDAAVRDILDRTT